MESALAQLQGDDYNRVLIYLSPSLEPGQTTYEFTDTIRSIARKYYPDGELYMAGDATNEYDFQKSFAIDNVVVNVVSIFIVLLVLLFTFQSVGMPILLIVVIQGAIWVNFSFPYFMGTNLYFMGYLIVSSIQMGANIDYAIVIATRFNELKDKMEHKQAMIETINFAFPTILTSGTIMTVSGILIGQMTSDACIVGIGQCLGRGTIISILLVLFVSAPDPAHRHPHRGPYLFCRAEAGGPQQRQWPYAGQRHRAGRDPRLCGRYDERHRGRRRPADRHLGQCLSGTGRQRKTGGAE